ncbi:MAG: hypothetical protein ACN6OC_16280 [Alcaligenes sp.]
MTDMPAVQQEQPIDVQKDRHVQALQEENRLLFDQLQVVQEELERRYYQAQAQPGAASAVAAPATVIHIAPVDERLIEVQAENLRCQALVKAQGEIHALQARHALANQLGDILIEGSRSTGAMLSVPARLHRAWRQNRRETPPASLGGKTFDKVLSAYQDGREAAVEALLNQASVSTATQASAWTAVARTQLYIDPALAAGMARRAYALEPRPFRQKWLAFRLHESGDLLEAEALLTLLPEDVKFSDSEARQVDRLKREARQYRLDQAREIHAYGDQQEKLQRQWQDLARSRDVLAGQAAQLRAQCESLQAELAAAIQARDQQSALAAQERERNESLTVELKQACEEQKDLVAQWFEQCVTLQTGVAKLTQVRDEQAVSVEQQQAHSEGLQAELMTLQQTREGLQTELMTLKQTCKEQAAQWLDQCAILQAGLAEASQAREELEALAAQRQAQCESLRLELEALMQTREELEALAVQRLADQDALRAELRDLSRSRDEQAALAAQRQGELLQQAREQLSLEKAKMTLETRQQELERLLADQARREQEQMQHLILQVKTLATQQPALRTVVEDLFKKQAEELLRVRRHLENVVKNNSANAARQVQSYIGMQEYLGTGSLPAFNSESHSWPVAADFALFLMQRLVLEQYDLVVEFGSGMSTVTVARTLAMEAERTGAAPARFVSFDHLDHYYQQTQAYLNQVEVAHAVELVLAPLKDWQAPDGKVQPYYDCNNVLAELARIHGSTIRRILVIVDGPPASTGPQARYPAGPMVVQHFPAARIDFLMDDYIRDDEKEVAQRWLADMKAVGLPGVLTEYKFEKDACLITVHPKDEKVK